MKPNKRIFEMKGAVHDACDALKQSKLVGQVQNLLYQFWEEYEQ